MAIRVDTIAFENFYNYFGSLSDNTFHFKEGLNLIVADNGAGKSKFFNGILWILSDYILDSETKKYKPIDTVKFNVISDKAKNNTEVDKGLFCKVKIQYTQLNLNKNYEIIKQIVASRREKGSPTDPKNWIVNIKDTLVREKEDFHHDFKPVYDKEQQSRIISALLRPEFRDYSLLQGEEVDNVIDLADNNSLTKAIESLSDIKDLEELSGLSNYLSEKSRKDLDKERKESSDNQNQFDYLNKKEEELRNEIKKLEDKLNRYNENLTKTEEEKEDLLNYITSAHQRQELRYDLDKMQSEFSNIEDEHANLHENINSFFFNDNYAWLLLGTDKYINNFYKNREVYINEREEKRAENKVKEDPQKYLKLLPADIPDLNSLERMLNEEVCFVCGQTAKKGSEAWEHLKSAKNRHYNLNTKETNEKNNLSRFFDDLQTNTRALHNKLTHITDSIKTVREKEKFLIDKKRNLHENIEYKKSELFEIRGEQEDNISDTNTIHKFSNIESNITYYNHAIRETNNNLEKTKNNLNNIEKEKQELTGLSLSEAYMKTNRVLNNINNAILNTKERIISDMVNNLENESNKHFRNLTKHSGIQGSNLKFVKTPNNTIKMKVEDSNGNFITGESEGFQRMKKIAVVMAIITSSKKRMLNYPFISDAPISAFGKSFMRGFFEQVPEVFHQSIILVKELYDKQSENKLTEYGQELYEKGIPSTLYINEVEEGKEQINRETKIIQYI